MEDETQNQNTEDFPPVKPPKKDYLLAASVLISALILAGAWVYTERLKIDDNARKISLAPEGVQKSALEEKVLPTEGVILPVRWGDLGAQLVSAGAIDEEKFKSLYDQ